MRFFRLRNDVGAAFWKGPLGFPSASQYSVPRGSAELNALQRINLSTVGNWILKPWVGVRILRVHPTDSNERLVISVEKIIRGYKVRTTSALADSGEADARRNTIAEVIAKSYSE